MFQSTSYIDRRVAVLCLIFLIFIAQVICKVKVRYRGSSMPASSSRLMYNYTKRVCIETANTLRARHKSCLLRPDTGPCRADIIQWYFDVRQHKCYRFFWGGCQGNGNTFETKQQCEKHCLLEPNTEPVHTPYFCDVAFDYGSCFGYFNRWGWDRLGKTCKPRLYSGCGGNQNNFETREACMATCSGTFSSSVTKIETLTTCIPISMFKSLG